MSEVNINEKYLTYEEMSDDQRKEIIEDALTVRGFKQPVTIGWWSIRDVERHAPPKPVRHTVELRTPKKGDKTLATGGDSVFTWRNDAQHATTKRWVIVPDES